MKKGENAENELDESYKNLECDITALKKNSKEYKIVKKYVENTHCKTHSWYTLSIKDILKVRRHGEEEKFKKGIGNRMLLWHGSRITNWVGILS